MTDEAATPTPDIPAELGGNPLTDEDVRRAEHPDEFADEAGSSSSSEDGEPATAAPVTPAAGTGALYTGSFSGGTGAVVTASSGGATIAPPAPPAAPEEPAEEPTAPVTPEPVTPAEPVQVPDTQPVTEGPAPPVTETSVPPPGALTRDEELGILARIEADAKALRDRLFGSGGQL